MMINHKRVYRVIALLVCSLVVSIIVASLVLAKRDASVYPGNLYAGPFYLGNMTRTEALQKLQDVAGDDSLSVDCIVSNGIYPLKLRDLGIKLDAQATINEIESEMEQWSLLDHSLYRGRKLVAPPVWQYDYDKLQQSLHNLALSKYKEAVDARVLLVGSYLLHQPEQDGAQIVPELAVDLLVEVLNEGQLKVILPEKTVAPAITGLRISSIQELLSVQAVPADSGYQYENDIGWAVPGKVILPGRSLSIGINIDVGAENGADMVAVWQEALSMAAADAGLIYTKAEQELLNRTDYPVALFITREKGLWLIRIYGQPKQSGPKVTMSRTYKPLLISPAVAGGPKNNELHEELYRHEFTDGQLQATLTLGEAAAPASGTNGSTINHSVNHYK